MASSREEQLRSNYRIARQAVGLIAIILVVIGLFTVISWAVHGVSVLLDDSDRRQSYADRLYGLVMFDTLPFDDINSVDPSRVQAGGHLGLCVSDSVQRRQSGTITSGMRRPAA